MNTAAGCLLLLMLDLPVVLGCNNEDVLSNCTAAYNTTIARNESREVYCRAGQTYHECLGDACPSGTVPVNYTHVITQDVERSDYQCDLTYLNWAARLGCSSILLMTAAGLLPVYYLA